ncbi:MAG: hypothetical protein Q3X94_08610 [Oscillospiraceae bacterium]|nr:hypothetical protein [Oscillospiraceae bacterium]
MKEEYQVTLQSQMGPREGRLTLQYKGSFVTGTLKLVGYVNAVRGLRSEDGTLHLFHSIQTAVSTFPCESVLQLQEGRLTGAPSPRPAGCSGGGPASPRSRKLPRCRHPHQEELKL